MKMPKLMICVQCKKAGEKEMCIVGEEEPLAEGKADEAIRRIEAYEGLVGAAAQGLLILKHVGGCPDTIARLEQALDGEKE